MKKRVFIAMHYLELGGAETSLVGLLHSFDYDRYDVDLFLYAHRGEMMRFVPEKVRILPEIRQYRHIESPIAKVVREGGIMIALARMWAKFRFAMYARKNGLTEGSAIFQYIHDAVSPFLPSLEHLGEYDLAISFLTPHRIVLDKVRAKKKIAWIHTDYSRISVDVDRELPVWRGYDRIASISDDVTKAFLSVFPSLAPKVVVIENILSKDIVYSRAGEKDIAFPSPAGRINLLSIGRFTYPKNFENIPYICKGIRERGVDVCWYIIGYGGDEEKVRHEITASGMQEYVVLLGKQDNPYPYIKACDVYVQPSRFEGKSVTVREAQMLCKPVIITDYPTAHSQVIDGKDGVIVPIDNEGCAEGIAKVLKDTRLMADIAAYLETHDYTNEKEVEKIYEIMK